MQRGYVDQSDNLEDALNRAIQFAGASNYCPILVGSLGDARWGADLFSGDWFEHHDTPPGRIREIAWRLAACQPSGST